MKSRWSIMAAHFLSRGACMSRSAGAAAKLPGSGRKKPAVQALAGSEPISELSARLGVSRKFIYAQKDKASDALHDAFCSAVADDEVLFQLPVTRTWLRQVMVGLPLICRSSYRGVVEFMRDLLGVTVGVGSVHEVLHGAAQQAGAINREQDLSGIRVGLHDELFQGATPVLAGARRCRCAVDLLLPAGGRKASRRRHLGRAPARRFKAGAPPPPHHCPCGH